MPKRTAKNRPKRVPPNTEDPLSNSTPQRRLWGAREMMGFKRSKFAQLLGVTYSTVDNWDLGISTMKTDVYLRACELVGFTPEQIKNGHPREPAASLPTVPAGVPIELARALAYVADFIVAYVTDPRRTPNERMIAAHKSALRRQDREYR